MSRVVRIGGLAAIACGSLAVLLAGCGTSNYNALVGRRLAALRGAVKFQGLYAPTQLPGTPFSIRVPLEFEHSYQESSAHEDDGATINPDRLQPPFLKLPGFKLCYEGISKTGANELPFYCYLAAVPAQPGDAAKLAGQLQTQLKARFPDATGDWQSNDAPTPDGYNVHWRKIRVEGDQPFLVKTGDQVAPQNLPGVFELWVHDADNYVLLVGWRSPKSIDAPSETTITSPFDRPANAKPDLTTMPEKSAGTLNAARSE